MDDWTLQDAKNRFSAVVNAALAGEPQRVTRRGKPAVIVLSVEEYERLCQAEKARAPNFIEHPQSPNDGGLQVPIRAENKSGAPDFIDYLLAIPQDDGEFERLPLSPRPVDF